MVREAIAATMLGHGSNATLEAALGVPIYPNNCYLFIG
jgi:hypothetical protein